MPRFFVFALAFAGVLTLVVRLGQFRVRRELSYKAGLGLTWVFIGLLLLTWWLVTHGSTIEDRLLPPLILPSPLEVLKAFPALHARFGAKGRACGGIFRDKSRFVARA